VREDCISFSLFYFFFFFSLFFFFFLFFFTSDQQKDPHAENHVAIERPMLIGQADHFREHPSAARGPRGPIRKTGNGNDGVASRRRRRQREATPRRGGRDCRRISVPCVADRNCIFFRRRPSTTLSAYSSTTVPATLPTARLTRAITTDDKDNDEDDEDDEDSERNRRLSCASARDGTAGPDMAITRVDSRGLVPGAGAYHPPITLQPPRCRARLLRSASRSIERPSRNVYRPSFIRAVIKRSAKAVRL